MPQIITNMKGSRHLEITQAHLQTIERYALLNDVLDSNGIVDDATLDKIRLTVRSLLGNNADPDLLRLASEVLFHDNMKAFGLHQLILLYIEWQKQQIDALRDELETEAES